MAGSPWCLWSPLTSHLSSTAVLQPAQRWRREDWQRKNKQDSRKQKEKTNWWHKIMMNMSEGSKRKSLWETNAVTSRDGEGCGRGWGGWGWGSSIGQLLAVLTPVEEMDRRRSGCYFKHSIEVFQQVISGHGNWSFTISKTCQDWENTVAEK